MKVGHYKARKEKPSVYPDRYPVPDQYTSWDTDYPGYTPVYFVAPTVIDNDRTKNPKGWADPEDITKVNREIVSYEGEVQFDAQGRPINIRGRTGVQGRGLLGKWGPNFAADPIITRVNSETGEIEMVAILRDNGEWAIPGGMVDRGEDVSATLRRELREETGIDIDMREGVEMYRGYVDDPRNTDNAWMETIAKHRHLPPEIADKMQLKAEDKKEIKAVRWMPLTEENINNLYASHSMFVKKALARVLELRTKTEESTTEKVAQDIAGVVDGKLGIKIDIKVIETVLKGAGDRKVTLADILGKISGDLTSEQLLSLLSLGDEISKLESLNKFLGGQALDLGGQVVLSVMEQIVNSLGGKKEGETIEGAFRRLLSELGVIEAETDSIFKILTNNLSEVINGKQLFDPVTFDEFITTAAEAIGISKDGLLKAFAKEVLGREIGDDISPTVQQNIFRNSGISPTSNSFKADVINAVIRAMFDEGNAKDKAVMKALTAKGSELINTLSGIAKGTIEGEENLDSPLLNVIMRIRAYKGLKNGQTLADVMGALGSYGAVKALEANTEFANNDVPEQGDAKGTAQVSRFSEAQALSEYYVANTANVQNIPHIISLPYQAVFPDIEDIMKAIKAGDKQAQVGYFAGLKVAINENPNLRVVLQTPAEYKDIVEGLIKEAGFEGRVFVGAEVKNSDDIKSARDSMVSNPNQYGLKDIKNGNIVFFTVDAGLDTKGINTEIQNNEIKVFGIKAESLVPALILGSVAGTNNVFDGSRLTDELEQVLRKIDPDNIEAILKQISEGNFFITVMVTTADLLKGYQLRRATIDIAA